MSTQTRSDYRSAKVAQALTRYAAVCAAAVAGDAVDNAEVDDLLNTIGVERSTWDAEFEQDVAAVRKARRSEGNCIDDVAKRRLDAAIDAAREQLRAFDERVAAERKPILDAYVQADGAAGNARMADTNARQTIAEQRQTRPRAFGATPAANDATPPVAWRTNYNVPLDPEPEPERPASPKLMFVQGQA